MQLQQPKWAVAREIAAAMAKDAIPDTLVWRTPLAYNEPMVLGYFRAKAFNDYPVVGVSWEQANKYCRWRTDRANEKTLVYYGLIGPKERYVGKINGKDKLEATQKGNNRLKKWSMIIQFGISLEAISPVQAKVI